MDSPLERNFDLIWLAIGGPRLEKEFRFHGGRKWRFDRALVREKIAFEIEGGTWSGGRHTSGIGFRNDCEKDNCALALGWRVFRLTSEMVSVSYMRALLVALGAGSAIDFKFPSRRRRRKARAL